MYFTPTHRQDNYFCTFLDETFKDADLKLTEPWFKVRALHLARAQTFRQIRLVFLAKAVKQ